MLTFVYQGLLLILGFFVVCCMFREKDFWKQVTGAMVIVPIVLRILMIK